MFASISNFLFGSEVHDENVEVELTTSTLPHTDWELVDKVDTTLDDALHSANTKPPKKRKQVRSSGLPLTPITNNDTCAPYLELCKPYDVTKHILDENHVTMDESWVMTPPPCFTASMPGSTDTLVINPLENALIEHPSMSVYHPSKSKKTCCAKSGKQPKSVTREGPRRACAVAARAGLLIDVDAHRSSQRIAQAVNAGHTTKKQCERSNKCAKIGKKGSQFNRTKNPCGSMNNRAC